MFLRHSDYFLHIAISFVIASFTIKLTICDQLVCLNGGVLVTRPTLSVDQVCICPKNFIGTNCEKRIDKLSADEKKKFGCALRPCWMGSTCEDREGSFVCHCAANTFGEFCEQSSLSNSDPCASKPCYNYGTCSQQDQNSFTCTCNGSHGGLSCKQNLLGGCASNPCLKDGICVPVGANDYTCQCPDWTIGKNCETVFNPCTRVSCLNNASCLKRRTLAFECNCTAEYTGVRCDQLVSKSCKSIPCAYGKCVLDRTGHYACACITQGYEGTYCEIERCNPKCKYGACVKSPTGAFYCVCGSIFTGPSCSDLICFAGNSLVETLDGGFKLISTLKRGDMIKSFDTKANRWTFSKFVAYLHQDASIVSEYIRVETSANKSITISPNHLIARVRPAASDTASKTTTTNERVEFVLAKELRAGDLLFGSSSRGDDRYAIVRIKHILETGAYAPLTESGTLTVNSLLVSCYANTKYPHIAHVMMQPLVFFSQYFEWLYVLFNKKAAHATGSSSPTYDIHPYAKFLYNTFHSILPFATDLLIA